MNFTAYTYNIYSLSKSISYWQEFQTGPLLAYVRIQIAYIRYLYTKIKSKSTITHLNEFYIEGP